MHFTCPAAWHPDSCILGLHLGYIGIMEKKMETTDAHGMDAAAPETCRDALSKAHPQMLNAQAASSLGQIAFSKLLFRL